MEQLRAYTYADLLALPEDDTRREIIDGELIVSPSPHWSHQRLLFRFARWIEDAAGVLGEVAIAPLDVRLTDRDSVQPDILFVRSERMHILAADGRITGAPDIVVEIVSPSSSRLDRVRKFALYERAGVPEYWILDARDRSVAAHELVDGRYHAISPDADGRVRSRVLPAFAVSPQDLFAGIPGDA